MRRKEAVRDYKFPDAALIQMSDDILGSVNRDDQEFNLRGYTADKRSAFRLMRDTFNDLPADSSLEGIKISTTQRRDDIRNRLLINLRTVHTIFENKWGKNDGRFKELGSANISRLKDEQLFRTARGVKNAALKYIGDLKNDGLTSELITEIDNLTTSFDDAIDLQQNAIKVRDIYTDERVTTGNRLYKELVKICNIGKDIWYSVNEAKYNDYIIYNTLSGKKEDDEIPPPPVV